MIYANEFEPKTAYWLSQLPLSIDTVDERCITEVKADELSNYIQCHFFAGIGGWPYALQLAGWPEDEPVWTGSCPCQPFSSAGQGKGQSDQRHLWPVWFELIKAYRPPVIFGEQVASASVVGTVSGDRPKASGGADVWLDRVSADLEGAGYAVGASVLGAHSVGSPHIRQRLFWGGWLDDSAMPRLNRSEQVTEGEAWNQTRMCMPSETGRPCGLVHTSDGRSTEQEQRSRVGQPGEGGGLADTEFFGLKGSEPTERATDSGGRRPAKPLQSSHGMEHSQGNGREQGRAESIRRITAERLSQDAMWQDVDYLWCSDGKYRPVESGTFPLAHGLPGRVAQLRGLGNAIVPQLAATFVKSFVEAATAGH